MNDSVFASRILVPSELSTTLAPSLNFRLLVQLELSVKEISLTKPTPSLRFKNASPVSRGFFPSLSLTMLFLNSSSVQLSPSSPSKSPSRTTISTLAEDSGPDLTTSPVRPSTKATWMEEQSSPSIRVPVNTGRERAFENCNCKLLDSKGCNSFSKFLTKSLQINQLFNSNRQEWLTWTLLSYYKICYFQNIFPYRFILLKCFLRAVSTSSFTCKHKRN